MGVEDKRWSVSVDVSVSDWKLLLVWASKASSSPSVLSSFIVKDGKAESHKDKEFKCGEIQMIICKLKIENSFTFIIL